MRGCVTLEPMTRDARPGREADPVLPGPRLMGGLA
jgi:hypothetical protein